MTSPTDPQDVDVDIVRVAALAEPIRRELYRFVAAQPGPVSRDHAAQGVGVAHHVAKFHLDKLEQDGLLDVEFRRPAGRTGPGAGRPAKLYRRSAQEIAVTLPVRRYDLAGQVMAEAITAAAASGESVAEAVRTAATAAGRHLGRSARSPDQPASSRAETIRAVQAMLAANGYEPRVHDACITLDNCPFHRLAQDYTELVCTMNLSFVQGLLDEVGDDGLHARLDPAPDRCCVTVAEVTAGHA